MEKPVVCEFVSVVRFVRSGHGSSWGVWAAAFSQLPRHLHGRLTSRFDISSRHQTARQRERLVWPPPCEASPAIGLATMLTMMALRASLGPGRSRPLRAYSRLATQNSVGRGFFENCVESA